MKKSEVVARRERRHRRVRAKVSGTLECPRLNVFRSLRHIFAQIIDDTQGQTLAAASTLDKDVRANAATLDKKAEAKAVGKLIAARALEKGLKQVVFDRGGFRYHGRVQALAEGAREGGLEF
ncbi:MAG: 50S ribosomal protein L18 [Chloroflexi bacterium]|nr:50S ribosomal protein L18 [Chloroflexota bacterium]